MLAQNKCRGSTCLGKYSCANIVKDYFGMMYYEKWLRLLDNLEQVNEDTIDELAGEKCTNIVSCQV